MRSLRLGLLTAILALLASAPAVAQWWPFSTAPQQSPQPPRPVPAQPYRPGQLAPIQPGDPVPVQPGAPAQPGEGGAPPMAQPSGPPQARPQGVRTAGEDSVTGRVLRRNGSSGSLRLDRAAGGLSARMTIEGSRISQPTQSCEVQIGATEPVQASPAGRPAGTLRFQIDAPSCPMALDVLDGAVLISEPVQECVFEASDCKAEVRGMWGPEPAGLLAQSRAIEQARGRADQIVRENYKALNQKFSGVEARAVITEQAGFSAERTVMCRDYAREATHGFCHARFTEARAASLAARLGLSLSSDQPPPRERPRPAAPRPETQAQPRQGPLPLSLQ